MDQAHIRALVSGISYFVTGLPLSWIGDHRCFLGAHKKISRVPLNRARRRVTDSPGLLTCGAPPYPAPFTGTRLPMSQINPQSSRAIAAVTLLVTTPPYCKHRDHA